MALARGGGGRGRRFCNLKPTRHDSTHTCAKGEAGEGMEGQPCPASLGRLSFTAAPPVSEPLCCLCCGRQDDLHEGEPPQDALPMESSHQQIQFIAALLSVLCSSGRSEGPNGPKPGGPRLGKEWLPSNADLETFGRLEVHQETARWHGRAVTWPSRDHVLSSSMGHFRPLPQVVC